MLINYLNYELLVHFEESDLLIFEICKRFYLSIKI